MQIADEAIFRLVQQESGAIAYEALKLRLGDSATVQIDGKLRLYRVSPMPAETNES